LIDFASLIDAFSRLLRSLREMLDEVANFYDSEVDVRLNAITTFIEPVILVFMGSLVMTILLAMYLPLFNMIGNLSGGRG